MSSPDTDELLCTFEVAGPPPSSLISSSYEGKLLNFLQDRAATGVLIYVVALLGDALWKSQRALKSGVLKDGHPMPSDIPEEATFAITPELIKPPTTNSHEPTSWSMYASMQSLAIYILSTRRWW